MTAIVDAMNLSVDAKTLRKIKDEYDEHGGYDD